MNKPHHFTTHFDQLPQQLPAFPLDSALLLPDEILPLNIFEKRYINIVLDALKEQRMIGMIRHRQRRSGFYEIGCAGRIIAFEEMNDGRFQIALRGVSRFYIEHFLPEARGYKRIQPHWDPFQADLEKSDGNIKFTSGDILRGMQEYLEQLKVRADYSVLEHMPSSKLVNFLSCHLPFSPREKQSLLEAESEGDRLELIQAITEMAVVEKQGNRSLH